MESSKLILILSVLCTISHATFPRNISPLLQKEIRLQKILKEACKKTMKIRSYYISIKIAITPAASRTTIEKTFLS